MKSSRRPLLAAPLITCFAASVAVALQRLLLCRPARLGLRRTLALALSLGALVAPTAAQMDVTEVAISAFESRTADLLDPLPFTFEIAVEGTGIATVSVVTPSGAQHNLVPDADTFSYWRSGLASLADMSNHPDIGFGNFDFTFTPVAGAPETAAVVFDPGLAPPHAGYGGGLSPTHGSVGVRRDPTFTWACTGTGLCGDFAWFLEVFPTAGPGPDYESSILDPSVSSWAPGCLAASTNYEFWIASATILGGVVQPLTTTPGPDPFDFLPLFETQNKIVFTTAVAIGANYCSPAANNSSGSPATICAAGSNMVAATDLHLYAAELPDAQFGYFLASQTQGLFNPPGSSGLICLGGNIGRYNQVANIIQGPMGSIQIDLTAIPVNPPTAVIPGDTWNFQCWFRDIGSTSNFTDAVRVTFI